ncbi:YciI family protein [Steroidobacter agaridevorans]|uniref:hypothetical protein n=1 Tax=Steroidobacter agaridevorans TaxID=2695856 RepID=UPI001326FDF9|nr:hypothetical protein [Steroidobacter agaridevorans]GFE86526.1 hypothetical protein GCM10011488_14800 [Steroidobacter agaridevorans]
MTKTLIATTGLVTSARNEARASDCGRIVSGPTWLVVYSPGARWLEGKPLSEQPLRAHGMYMLSLYREGVLRWAGGYGDDSGGAAAFTAPNATIAQQIVERDPAVKDAIFTFVLRQWNLVDWAAVDKRSTGAPRV